MEPSLTPRRSTYVGLFVVALATLVYEILLTRIFSVTMWYHFAFVAISVAMFGMTVGAVIVYTSPGLFRAERVHDRLALSALLFGAPSSSTRCGCATPSAPSRDTTLTT